MKNSFTRSTRLAKSISFSLVSFIILSSCSSSIIVTKTEKNFNEKRIATETLYEFGRIDYLRSEYAKNTTLTEAKISSIAEDLKEKKILFADSAKSAERQGQMVINAGEEVDVMARVFIKPIGDFFRIESAKGTFLVKDNEHRKLVSKDDYQKLQLKNVLAADDDAAFIVKNGEPQVIDYFNSATEKERLSKIQWFCKSYPQYKKYQKYAEDKKLTIGMPEHLLGLSWGQPARVEEEANETGTYRSFYYPGNYHVITRNAVIKSWKKVE